MSKVDVRVLNDLTGSKKRVMTNVMKHLEQRDIKKNARGWQYGFLTLMLSVCIGVFIYSQYNGGQEQSANIPTVLDEKILELYLQMDSSMNDENSLKTSSFDSFLHLESTFAYAQSKGLVPTQEEIGENLEIMMGEINNEIYPSFEELLQMLQLTRKEYIERYAKPISYKFATINLLREQAKNEYQDVNDQILGWIVERDALNYLEKHYNKEIASLREKYKIPVKESQMIPTRRGTVVAIKEHEFLVVSGVISTDIGKLSTDEIVQKHNNGTWFPRVDVPETLSIGDRVEVQYSMDFGSDASRPFIDFKDIVSAKIVEEY